MSSPVLDIELLCGGTGEEGEWGPHGGLGVHELLEKVAWHLSPPSLCWKGKLVHTGSLLRGGEGFL